ncbi:potassium uptake protein, TrkH family [Virgibacillus subterraneus]|uniref:Potassium uptake protein, TrkH family n=1 Tax=Virgibacillus subterraneus TaxID=621109 RepID=A0A1H9JU10_9BACI|nr:TrkH family potassium uptake protein [Virgibacillus subterraneus]SEQ90277.1 potassium uptake protein, TrkH family [Virgibacillus subterraneus]
MNKFSKLFKVSYLSTIRLIVLFYLIAVIFSMLLLSIPFFHNEGVDLTFIDILFTSVSAVSVTGLTVVSTADTFNAAGSIALSVVLQFGGIGIMTLGTFIWILLGKKVGLRGRQLIQIDQNQTTLGGLVQLLLKILKIVLLIELIGTIILSTYFLSYFDTWQEALLQGFFGAVSATTNAGFDITGSSLVPFANDYFVQFINIILLTLGAIGFPVLLELQDFIRGDYHERNPKHSFSLFSKLTTVTFFALILAGWLLILILEHNSLFFADKSWHERIFYSLFQSVTTRNGGLATMDVNEFTSPTLIMMCVLMFIGASPSSVGGGIRTTTFAIMLLAIYNYAKGRTSIKVFGRELDNEEVIRSFIVITTAAMLCITAIIVLNYVEPFPLLSIAFEVSSAFGTTGLSMGITSDLSNAGKGIIIFLMFVGRIGIFSFLFLIRGKVTKDKFHYPKEKVIIG